jgi:hypothetical protein
MKTKTQKLFLIIAVIVTGLLFTATVFAQSAHGPSQLGEPIEKSDIQVRLYAIELCKEFYQAKLSAENIEKLDTYVASLSVDIDQLPAYVPGSVEAYVLAHRSSDPLAQRYVKCQAIVAFPQGFSLTPDALIDIQTELNAVAYDISKL